MLGGSSCHERAMLTMTTMSSVAIINNVIIDTIRVVRNRLIRLPLIGPSLELLALQDRPAAAGRLCDAVPR